MALAGAAIQKHPAASLVLVEAEDRVALKRLTDHGREARPADDDEVVAVQVQLATEGDVRLVAETSGRLVKTTGDGILATLTVSAGGSAVRPRSETKCAASDFSTGRVCMPARSNCATARWVVSRCTSRRR